MNRRFNPVAFFTAYVKNDWNFNSFLKFVILKHEKGLILIAIWPPPARRSSLAIRHSRGQKNIDSSLYGIRVVHQIRKLLIGIKSEIAAPQGLYRGAWRLQKYLHQSGLTLAVGNRGGSL
jgi:hypothetical protein